jgi:hypothetical protein
VKWAGPEFEVTLDLALSLMASNMSSATRIPTIEKRSWRVRLVAEFENLLIIVSYLWVLLAVLQLHKGMVLAAYGIRYRYSEGMVFALVNAVVLGKFMLIGEALHAGERLQSKPLLYSTLFRTAIFTLILVACHVLEELLVALWHGESVSTIPDLKLVEIISMVLIAFVVLMPFFAFTELRRVVGKTELKSLLLERKFGGR